MLCNYIAYLLLFQMNLMVVAQHIVAHILFQQHQPVMAAGIPIMFVSYVSVHECDQHTCKVIYFYAFILNHRHYILRVIEHFVASHLSSFCRVRVWFNMHLACSDWSGVAILVHTWLLV